MTADSKSLTKSLSGSLKSALSVRDKLGLSKAQVVLVSRTWSGKAPGEGNASDERKQILPSPTIKDYGHDLRIVAAGAIQQGDLFLKHLPRELTRNEILNITEEKNQEQFWEIDGRRFQGVKEKDETFFWSLQVRPTVGRQ
jgi:hypothetical protein